MHSRSREVSRLAAVQQIRRSGLIRQNQFSRNYMLLRASTA
jgi:hypothetical protein